MSPDDLYFDKILAELAAPGKGVDASRFISRVRDRIRHGAELYGPHAYLDPERDNLDEALDEAADLVAYPLFELQRLNREPVAPHPVAVQLLFDAMSDAVRAAQKLQAARHLLRH